TAEKSFVAVLTSFQCGQQLCHGNAAMTDAIFFSFIQLSRSAIVGRDKEQGIITKTTLPARRAEDAPFPDTMAKNRRGVFRMPHKRQHAVVTRGALVFHYIIQFLKEFSVIG